MTELKQVFSNLGFKKVYSYIQSGNLIFETDFGPVEALKAMIEAKIREVFETRLKMKATARNYNTMKRLHETLSHF